jgi:hypothetical protein
VRKVTDIRIYAIGEGGYSDKRKWVEAKMPKSVKNRLLKKMNFLNRIPFSIAIRIVKKRK